MPTTLRRCLPAALLVVLPAVARSGDPGAPAEGPLPGGLSDEELQRRRQALDGWAFEPVALSTPRLELRLDRRDGSFFVRDAQTGVQWLSPWGRRGFASVLVGAGSGPDGTSDGPARWVPIDRVEDVRADDRSVRFRGASSAAPIPDIRFEVRVLDSHAGVSIRYELAPAAAPATAAPPSAPTEPGATAPAPPPATTLPAAPAVRILDGALWIPDAEDGWAAIPRGLGERLSSRSSVPAAAGGDAGGAGPADGVPVRGELTLPWVGLMRSASTVLVRWLEPATTGRVERRTVGGTAFPGLSGLFTTIECRAPSASVELHVLGREWSPVVDCARAYLSVSRAGQAPIATLRLKTSSRPELRALAGAAIFRPRVEGPADLDALGRTAARLRNELGVDEAAFILSGWMEPGSPATAPAARGGDAGETALLGLGRGLRELGFLFGLEAPEWTASLVGTDEPILHIGEPGGPAPSSAAEEVLEDLASRLEPQILLLGSARLRDEALARPETIPARAALGALVRRTAGLAAWTAPIEADLESAAWVAGPLDGLLEGTEAAARPRDAFWPVLPATFGHLVRIGPPDGTVAAPDDPAAVLACLLLGEVPVYRVPGPGDGAPAVAPDGDPRWCFARREGWAAGKDLSPTEIFIKNTYEVLSHVARLRVRDPLLYHRALDAAGHVRETWFGPDLRIVVNFGQEAYDDADDGFRLPPNGFYVRHPFLLAFHALRIHGVDYDRPALFCVRSLEGKMYLRAEQVRIYHGFGPEEISLGGKTFRVEREAVVKIW